MPLFMLLTRSTSRDALVPVATSIELSVLYQRAADLNGTMPRWGGGTVDAAAPHRVRSAPRGSAGGRWVIWQVPLPPNVEVRTHGGPSCGTP